jgi:fluoride exporter
MMAYVYVFLGAGIGGAARHGVNLACARLFGMQFPWGTLSVNVIGSLLIGLLAGWFAFRSGGSSQHVRLFLVTGVLGGFTTFSAFSLDVALLWERGAMGLSMTYVLLSVAVSVVAVFSGLALARSLA